MEPKRDYMNNKKIMEYWNRDEVESMYDKNLLNAEIRLIKKRVTSNSKILDAGCGEGEGTIEYSKIPDSFVHAVDFSDKRLEKATERLKNVKNVLIQKVDFLGDYSLRNDYDYIVSQRFLINLMEWELQSKVILNLMSMLKPCGKLLMLEGSQQGVKELNDFRSLWGLEPISVKWHNLFFDDDKLKVFMNDKGFTLLEQDGLGSYFLLTRGIRPVLDKDLNWESKFNEIAAQSSIEDLLNIGLKFSRLKLWVFQK